MRGQVTKLPLDELVEDTKLYPRVDVDTTHVSSLCEAMRQGQKLPPIIVDKRSRRIVDGFHRVRAWRRVYGAEAPPIEVELVDYADEAAILIDAVRRNAAHGRVLDSQDKIRIVRMMSNAGIAVTTIAETLHVTTDTAKALYAKVAEIEQHPAYPADTHVETYVPLKASVSHFAGRTMTPEQAEAHKSAPGTSYMLLVRQLQQGLEFGLVDDSNTTLREALVGLRTALDAYLAKSEVVA